MSFVVPYNLWPLKEKDVPKRNAKNNDRFDLSGNPIVSKTAGIPDRWKDMNLYTEGELGDIVKVGCTTSSGTRNAISLASASLWKPINRGAINFYRSRMYVAMLDIDNDCSVAYACDQAIGSTFRFDITSFRLCLS